MCANIPQLESLLLLFYQDKVSIDLGFYYMANAMGRLVGTLAGGFLYHYTVKRRLSRSQRLLRKPLFCIK